MEVQIGKQQNLCGSALKIQNLVPHGLGVKHDFFFFVIVIVRTFLPLSLYESQFPQLYNRYNNVKYYLGIFGNYLGQISSLNTA